jgi:dihydroneopterin aldolase
LKNNTQILKIKGMEFYSCHGVYRFEKTRTTRFIVDVEIVANFEKSMQSDLLEDTIDYEIIYNKISEIMNKSSNLIEYLVQEISKEILPLLSIGNQLKIEIHKMQPPVNGKVNETAFEAIYIK